MSYAKGMKILGSSEAQRLEVLSKLKDPLQTLDAHIDFELFRPTLAKIFPALPARAPGRRRFDPVIMFKILILQRLYNLSDEQTEFQLNDRRSFLRFAGLGVRDAVPDHTTIWTFRETLTKHHTVEELFDQLTLQLTRQGVITQKGVIVDASFTEVPRQRNNHAENDQIKAGKTPQEWEGQSHMLSQKDVDARWTRQKSITYFGYKNHVAVDRDSKLILNYKVTPANTYDGTVFEELLPPLPEGTPVYGDTAYPSRARYAWLEQHGLVDKLQVKATAKRPLSVLQKLWNQSCAKVRCRVEHVFGFMENSMHGPELEYIGLKRISTGIGLNNLVYNLVRWVQLQCKNPPQFCLFEFRNQPV